MINIKAFTKRILKNVNHNKKSYQIKHTEFRNQPYKVYIISVSKSSMGESFFNEMNNMYRLGLGIENEPFVFISKRDKEVLVSVFFKR